MADIFSRVHQAHAGDTFLIVGFGQWTGPAAARFLERCGLPYAISDCAAMDELAPRLAGLSPRHVYGGPQTADHLDGITAVLLSPGVPRTIAPVRAAVLAGLPVWGDLDFLLPMLDRPKLIGVSGTDGKTTTVTLLGEICSRFGKTVVCGNNGLPVMDSAGALDAADFAVVEVSSFMLEHTRRLRFDASVILNIAQDHVDRYESLESYRQAKLNIFAHARKMDVFLRNADDPALRDVVPSSGRVRDFGLDLNPFDAASDAFVLRGQSLPVTSCRLQGRQFLPDLLATLVISDELGFAPGPVMETIREFPGVPHRFRTVGEPAGVRVIDDSKATSVQAVAAALDSCPIPRTVVLLGGREKHLDFRPLADRAARCAGVVCYGEAGERIQRELGLRDMTPSDEDMIQGRAQAIYISDFREAVRRACTIVPRPGCLLLSPGCTSWDQFQNYEVRGRVFAEEAIRALAVEPHP
ncbi:UDP-N-acetylmuramoyl-L-alanine--D-glutamate ligase [Myxococcota bacterium]|nr:UDP-N-acetylmuramoyl-L-alanine--D-glutamate ligase [Myxococcota bacterium]